MSGFAAAKASKDNVGQQPHERAHARFGGISALDRTPVTADGMPPIVRSVLQREGQPLEPSVRASMEERLGHDFSRVRVHNDPQAAASARAVSASAYTVGQHIVFRDGRYAPYTAPGRHSLAHELAHVVQQERGGAPPALNPDSAVEQAADQAASALSAGCAMVHVAGASATGIARQTDAEEERRKQMRAENWANMPQSLQTTLQNMGVQPPPEPSIRWLGEPPRDKQESERIVAKATEEKIPLAKAAEKIGREPRKPLPVRPLSDGRHSLNRLLLAGGLKPIPDPEYRPTEFEKMEVLDKANPRGWWPVYDPDTGNIARYRRQSGGYWEVRDPEGKFIRSGEAPIESSAIQPDDLLGVTGPIRFAGRNVIRIGAGLLPRFGKRLAQEAGEEFVETGLKGIAQEGSEELTERTIGGLTVQASAPGAPVRAPASVTGPAPVATSTSTRAASKSLSVDPPGPGTSGPGGGRPGSSQNVLVVGAETRAEFGYAGEVATAGQTVTVVNPVATAEAQAFAARGGNFVQGVVEDLPLQPAYTMIREDFPFPLGRAFQPTVDFAAARIERLTLGGRWVVVTEQAEFARTLEAVAATRGGVRVTVREIPRLHEAAPVSAWPREQNRFVLIMEKEATAISGALGRPGR